MRDQTRYTGMASPRCALRPGTSTRHTGNRDRACPAQHGRAVCSLRGTTQSHRPRQNFITHTAEMFLSVWPEEHIMVRRRLFAATHVQTTQRASRVCLEIPVQASPEQYRRAVWRVRKCSTRPAVEPSCPSRCAKTVTSRSDPPVTVSATDCGPPTSAAPPSACRSPDPT
jgi:hypothetical protein